VWGRSRLRRLGHLACSDVLEDGGDDAGIFDAAITRNLPPHLGQVSMSTANTRFRRCIQVMGARGLSSLSRGSGVASSGDLIHSG
jgi:hypothetical protein